MFGTLLMGPQIRRTVKNRPAGLGEGEEAAAARGAGATDRAETGRPLLGCPGSGQRYFGPFFESSTTESFVWLDCLRAAAATSARPLTQDAGGDTDSLHFLPSAGGVA